MFNGFCFTMISNMIKLLVVVLIGIDMSNNVHGIVVLLQLQQVLHLSQETAAPMTVSPLALYTVVGK